MSEKVMSKILSCKHTKTNSKYNIPNRLAMQRAEDSSVWAMAKNKEVRAAFLLSEIKYIYSLNLVTAEDESHATYLENRVNAINSEVYLFLKKNLKCPKCKQSIKPFFLSVIDENTTNIEVVELVSLYIKYALGNKSFTEFLENIVDYNNTEEIFNYMSKYVNIYFYAIK